MSISRSMLYSHTMELSTSAYIRLISPTKHRVFTWDLNLKSSRMPYSQVAILLQHSDSVNHTSNNPCIWQLMELVTRSAVIYYVASLLPLPSRALVIHLHRQNLAGWCMRMKPQHDLSVNVEKADLRSTPSSRKLKSRSRTFQGDKFFQLVVFVPGDLDSEGPLYQKSTFWRLPLRYMAYSLWKLSECIHSLETVDNCLCLLMLYLKKTKIWAQSIVERPRAVVRLYCKFWALTCSWARNLGIEAPSEIRLRNPTIGRVQNWTPTTTIKLTASNLKQL